MTEDRGVITTDHLSKWYGQVIGLNDVTLTVPAGITGLLGPNGAGKSTFLKLITGQVSGPELFMSGKLKVEGDLMFAPQIASMFQRPPFGLPSIFRCSSVDRDGKRRRPCGT